jgi:hypothetical protein
VYVGERSRQLSLNFEPGLTAKHRQLEDCIAHTVHNSRQGVDGVALALDMGASELSRRLNAHLDAKAGDANNRPLRVADMVAAMRATGDYRPIYWLVEEFLQDPEAVRQMAMQQIPAVVELLTALAAQAGVPVPKVKR